MRTADSLREWPAPKIEPVVGVFAEKENSNMMSRREALQGLSAGIAVAGISSFSMERPGSDSLSIGIVGCGPRGRTHARLLADRPDVKVTSVCDADQGRAERAAVEVERACGKKPVIVQDMRRILDDLSVNAVTIATPPRWHAAATVLACKAGKHVYVEAPCTHTVREGRQLIDAARTHGRVVQTGTQARSSRHVRQAMRLLYEGAIGDVVLAKAWSRWIWSYAGRNRDGKPLARGTCGPDHAGFPELDLARWGLGVDDRHPEAVMASCALPSLADGGQLPETRQVTWDYAPTEENGQRRQLIAERPSSTPGHRDAYQNGTAFYGTQGFLLLGRHGSFRQYDKRNRLISEVPAEGTGTGNTRRHLDDFLGSIRSGRPPLADIRFGVRSATAFHLAGIASRLRRTLFFDTRTEQFIGDGQANRLLAEGGCGGRCANPS